MISEPTKKNIKLQNVLGTPALKKKYKHILGNLYLNLILTYLKIFQDFLYQTFYDTSCPSGSTRLVSDYTNKPICVPTNIKA